MHTSTNSSMQNLDDIYAEAIFYSKSLFVTQAKQLVRLFSADLNSMVNALIKINQNFDVDFSFVDKVLTHMVGLQKTELIDALKLSDTPKEIKDRVLIAESAREAEIRAEYLGENLPSSVLASQLRIDNQSQNTNNSMMNKVNRDITGAESIHSNQIQEQHAPEEELGLQ